MKISLGELAIRKTYIKTNYFNMFDNELKLDQGHDKLRGTLHNWECISLGEFVDRLNLIHPVQRYFSLQ